LNDASFCLAFWNCQKLTMFLDEHFRRMTIAMMAENSSEALHRQALIFPGCLHGSQNCPADGNHEPVLSARLARVL
jgi:hypothetical protein